MAVVYNQRTGRSVTIDLRSADITQPAVLPSSPVEEGLPVTDQRSELPVEVLLQAINAAIQAEADDADTVRAFFDNASTNADRLSIIIPNVPTFTDLMIAGRAIRPDARTSSVMGAYSLHQVRVVSSSVGTVSFPTPRSDLESGRTAAGDGGEQAPREPARPRASVVKILAGQAG